MEVAIAALIGSATVFVGIWQLYAGNKAMRVQRVIDLHRDLTTGEVGEARDRFTSLMWKAGEETAGRNRCHRFRWEEIQSPVRTADGSVQRGRLGTYADYPEIVQAIDAEPMRDLYAVLWCFERVEAGRQGKALDDAMLRRTIASHAVWWDELTKDLDADPRVTTRHLAALRSLAAALRTPELEAWAKHDFEHR